MRNAITAACAIVAAVSSIGWFTQRVSTATLLWYLEQKKIPFPSDEEMRRGSEWVTSHMVKDLLSWKDKN